MLYGVKCPDNGTAMCACDMVVGTHASYLFPILLLVFPPIGLGASGAVQTGLESGVGDRL